MKKSIYLISVLFVITLFACTDSYESSVSKYCKEQLKSLDVKLALKDLQLFYEDDSVTVVKFRTVVNNNGNEVENDEFNYYIKYTDFAGNVYQSVDMFIGDEETWLTENLLEEEPFVSQHFAISKREEL